MVRFEQPNSQSVALNRVLGSDPSSILGSLVANGKVFLVNPNGILFGKGASVNVSGLVASTLDIANSDFLAGNYRFNKAGNGTVLNQGTLNAAGGYVALLGANVSNEGVINARLGSVALVGGDAVTLDVAGDGLLKVSVDQGALNALVSNGGMIKADGGQVLLSAQAAGTLLKTVVNNTGVIEAHTIDKRGGSIKLLGDMQSGTVNASGTLDASAPAAGDGGFVETSAAHVAIAPALKVSSAAAHGLTGTWLIDPTDFNIAARGGDMTGAALSAALAGNNVQIQSAAGVGGTAGNINVNDTIAWSANKLTLTAQNNINVNTAMRGSGTASLALEYGQGAVIVNNPSTYNVAAEIDLPAGNNFSTKRGSNGPVISYKVITSLGAAGSVSTNDLQGINGALTGNYVLGSNIDASATASWNGGQGFNPLGPTGGIGFRGRFDGLGHVINNLYINRNDVHVGLFGAIDPSTTVANVGLVNVSMEGTANNAVGHGALAGFNAGEISNSFASGTVKANIFTYLGGLVGYNSDGVISNSHANVNTLQDGYYPVGGLVGETYYGQISNSFATGNVVNTIGDISGGLIGQNNRGGIFNSFATGSVTGSAYVGGLVGVVNYGLILDSFASGNVIGSEQLGGLVGKAYQATIERNSASGSVAGGSRVGGLVGVVSYSQISNTHASGAVSATTVNVYPGDSAGGLLGYVEGFTSIANSYATGDVSGVMHVGGVVGTFLGSISMTRVYASGQVNGTTNVGGVIGRNFQPNSIANGFFNASLNPTRSAVGANFSGGSGSATGLTTAQMLTPASFTGFNFTTSAGGNGNSWVTFNGDGTLNGAGGTRPMLTSEWSSTINTAHQLQMMRLNLSGAYTLGRDIDAAATAGSVNDVWAGGSFIPVGTGDASSTATHFSGSLDGANHVITGLTINRPGLDYNGLFGTLGTAGVVQRLGIVGGSLSAGADSGALAGNSHGTIRTSFSTMPVSTTGQRTGGLVGSIVAGSVNDSYATGSVTSSAAVVGGLAGRNMGAINNSYATGAVSGAGLTGGLAGNGSGTSTGSFWDSTTTGQATSGGGASVGLSSAGMQTLANFNSATAANGLLNPDWELQQTWVVYDGHSNPLLRGFMTPLTVRAVGATKTYDGLAYATVAYSDLVNANLQGTAVIADTINAGTRVVTPSGLYSNGGQFGYSISYLGGTLQVNPLALSLTGAAAANKAYDGGVGATVTGTLAGVLAGDTGNVSAILGGSFAGADVGNGIAVTATAGLGGSAGGNYSLAAPLGLTANITPKALTVTGTSVTSKAYDGSNSATLAGATLSGLVGVETLVLSGLSGTYNDQNAALGKAVTVSGATLGNGTGLASNYSVTNPTGITGDITAKALTITGTAVTSKTYDGSNSATLTGGALSGMVGIETLGLSGLSGTYNDQHAALGKAVTISGATLSDGTGLAANYSVANPTGVTGDITAKALTITGTAVTSKAYDGNNSATLTGATLSGLVGIETLGLSGLSGAYNDQHAALGKAVTISGATLSDGSGLASNYSVANPTGITGDITAKALTITGTAVTSKTYDGSNSATLTGAALSGLVGIETLGLSGLSGTYNDQNAALGKAVTVSGATLSDGTGLASNYSVANPTGITGDITAKALTITGTAVTTKTYDGNNSATLTGAALSGMVGSETLGLSGLTGTYVDQNAALGKAVTVSGATLSNGTGLAANYTVANPAGITGDITAKALTVTGTTVSSKTYDGNNSATLSGATLFGLIGTEMLGLSGLSGAYIDPNAALGKVVTVSGATLSDGTGLAANYTVANPTGISGDITPKALAITGTTVTGKTYDGTTAATLAGSALSGLVGSETLGLSGLSGAYADQHAGLGKAVTVGGATLGNGTGLAANYTVANPTGITGNITPKALTITGTSVTSKTYDGTTAATLAGASLSGLVGSETLGLSGLSGAYADQHAALGKAVTVSGATLSNGTGLAADYTVANPTGITGDITPKALTVTGTSVSSKTYDGTTAATLAGASLAGLVGSETLVLAGQSATFIDSNAGLGKAVTITGASLGNGSGLASDYSVSNPVGVTGNITPKALTVTGMTANNKVYDASTAAVLSGGALSGLVGTETLGVAGASGAFANPNAGAGKAVTVSGITLADGTGLASNYSVANPTGLTADITPRALTVAGMSALDKVYDGGTAAQLSGGALVGLQGGETLLFSGHSGAFSSPNAASGIAVAVNGIALADGSGLASNYTLANPTGLSANITRKTLTVSGLAASDKVYDGTVAATLGGASLTGLVGGETLAFSAQGSFTDKNAGNGKTVALGNVALANGSGLAANYQLGALPASLSASISKAALSGVSGIGAADKVYDGSTSAVLNTGAAILSGKIAGDQLSVASAVGSFSDKNVANAKAVSITGITLGGADALNYTAPASAAASASISKAPLTVKVNDSARLTGTPNPAFSATYTGLVGGDSAAADVSGVLAFSTPANTGSAPGAYAVAGSGQSASNYALSFVDGVLTVEGAIPQSPLAVALEVASIVPLPAPVASPRQDAQAPGRFIATIAQALPAGAGGVRQALAGLNLGIIDTGINLPSAARPSKIAEDDK